MKSTPTNGTAMYTPSHCDLCGAEIGTHTGWAEPRIGTDGRAFLCLPCADASAFPPTDFVLIDRVVDSLTMGDGGAALAKLYPTDLRARYAAILRALGVLFPHVPETVCAERLAASILSL